MKKFNIIKKSRKKSKGIDEKIEYLNKECQKTGLQEVMTTTNMYTVVQTVPAAPAEFDDVPDVDPVNGITSDNWTQPLGNDDNGNPASEPPTTFPRIWDNPGYSDPTDGLLNKNDLTGNGTALPIYKTDDLTWQDPSEIPAGAVGGMQIEVGGMDPGIVGGYLDSNGWNTTTGTHVRLGAPNFKTHPHLFKPVKYWQPFSIYHPYIDSYWPGGDKTPKYGGIVKGSLDGPKYALFTAYMYVGGGRNTYQTSPNTHSYPIVLKTDDLGDPLFLPIDIGRFGLSPQGFYWLKDRATDLATKYKSEDDMWDAIADFLDKHNDPAEDPFSRKGTGMDDRWIGPPVDKAGYELEGQTLSEKSKSRHFKRKVKNEDVINNTKFNVIKKSRNKSKGIDEKIEYLNKECQKTGLQEVMTTSNIYVGTEDIPNTTYTDFESITVGGYPLGLSGADGNAAGGAINGDFHYSTGVALSPPHPVTGQRYTHYHVTDGTGGGTLLRPGQGMRRGFGNNRPLYTMGSALWFYDPNANNGLGNPPGRWFSFEYYNNNWGFWDTIKPPSTLAGFSIFNTNLSEFPSGGLGAEIASKISGINFSINGEIGGPTNTIFIKNDLGDPGFLPIDIDGISKQAFDYLRNKAGTNVASSLSGGGYGGYYDVGGGDYRGIDQILRMYNDPDKDKKYPDRMLKNIDQLMIDLDLVQGSVSDTDIPNPFTGAQDGDQFAFLPFGGGNNKPFDPTKKQNRKTTIDLINAVNSGDPLFLPPGVTMNQAREFVNNRNSGSLRETFKLRHFKPELKNEDVINNTKFNVIKKSRKKSKGIDEKIEYLNKECQKTGLNEIMNTTGMYQGSKKVPNQNVVDFQALDVNGFGLGLSPADGNGLGGAYIGTIESGMRNAGGSEIGMTGVAISPPHPVTGQRQVATTRTGMVDYSPARPGVDQTGNGYPTGSIAWVWDPNHPQFGPNGIWRQLQTHPSSGAWSFWDTGFLGFGFLNQNLSQMEFSDGSNLSSDVINVLQPLGVIAMQQGGIGEPQTTVLVQNNLDDPGFLPINIPDLSKQAFDYLKEKAGVSITNNYYSPEDKKNVINYYKKLQADPNYQPKPYEKESLIKQMRAQGDGIQIASTDLSTAFPPSPPDKEPVDPPPNPPSEPPAPPESNPYPDEKADPAGLDARALKLGYNDPYYPVNPTGHYIAMVTTAQDILSAEMEAEFYSAAARGESPNYDTASINQAKEKLKNARSNLDNWERWKKENNYIWKGPIDHAAEDQRRQAELEKQQRYETEKEKLEKAKEQAEADAEMHAAEAQKLLAEFGVDVFLALFGPGALKLAGKALGKLPAISKFFKLGKAAQKAQIDDALRTAKAAKVPKVMKAGKNLSADDVLDGFNNVDQNLYNLFKRNGPLSTSIDPIAGNMNNPGTVIRGRTGDILRIFDHKSGKFIKPDSIRLGASVELNKDKLLSEAAKNNTDIINSSKFKKYFK